MTRFISLLPLSIALAGCVIDGGSDDPNCADGKCDGGEDVCRVEQRYDNGTCDTNCAEADPDCFLLFDQQAAASTWFGALEEKMAMQEVREPRKLVATTDARFARMRALLDRGWQSYQKVMPVKLIDRAPELVVIDDPTANAFVALDESSNKAAWVVMVQTGAMEGQTDAALLGVVMHELTHAAKLHIMKGMADKIRVHYQVRASEPEPIGADQNDNPNAREAITAWRSLGEEAGNSPYVELHGIPVGEALLAVMLRAVLTNADTSNCQNTGAKLQQFNAFMLAHTNALTNTVEVPPADRPELDQLAGAVVADLRNECLASAQIDLFELMAMHFGVTTAEIAEKFPTTEQAMVKGKHIVDQITLLTDSRYRRMLDVAALVQQKTGRDISTLRYFSTEEAADDSTVPVLRDMGLAPDGVGQFFQTALLSGELGAQCTALLSAKTTPPYGDLVDEHHGTCWRIAHVRQLATRSSAARTLPVDAAPATGEYLRLAGERLPRFRLASDATSKSLR